MKATFSFLILLFFIVPSILFSQKYPFKVGKVDEADILIDSCSFYPEAKSMIIAQYGDLRFQYASGDGWQYRMEVGVRKKIFDITEASDAGNIKIRAYEPVTGGYKEDISSIKAYSHNMVNGKIEKDKLKSNDIYKKRINDNWVEYSFAIPNIKKGSIVEYSYVVISDYLTNLTTWHFQKDIPVALSDFRYTIPEWFNYQSSQLGYMGATQSEAEKRRETFTIRWADTKSNRGTNILDSESNYSRFIAKDVLPLEDEPYMNNKGSIPSRLEFQLISTNFPNQMMKVVAGSYPKFNEELSTSTSFGARLNKGRFIKSLELETDNPTQQAIEIYNHLQDHFDWDEKYRFLSADAGRPAYNKKVGNVADINLSFIAALRENGIEAYPVLLSTRGNGIVHPVYPSYADFNYVIAFIKVEDGGYFCDVTGDLPFGQLPVRCRNGQGWLVGENGGSWVDLKQNSSFNHTTMITSEIVGDSMISHVTKRDEGYAAFQAIKNIDKLTLDVYKQNLIDSHENADLVNLEVSELDLTKPVTIKYELRKKMGNSDIIYLEIPTIGTIKSNPFKKEERFSPIDFAYQQSYRLFTTFTIPEGYTATLPESIMIKLPDDNGKFIYQLSQNGRTISFRSDIFISKTDFSTLEYPQLKQFYELIEKKHAELIVLKK